MDLRFPTGPCQAEHPIEPLLLLAALHQRRVLLFESLIRTDWDRRFIHPEMGTMTLATILPLLVWHGRHHTAHITELRKRMGGSREQTLQRHFVSELDSALHSQ